MDARTDKKRIKLLYFDPYHAGSHAYVARQVAKYSRHNVTLVTLPGRFWKWRQAHGPFHLRQWLEHRNESFDLLFTTDYCDLATLKGLLPEKFRSMPSVLFMHEHQLDFPLPEHDRPDVHIALRQIASMLAADEIWWNSRTCMERFFAKLPDFWKPFPDRHPEGLDEILTSKSFVAYLPLYLAEFDNLPSQKKSGPLRILWNHRWDYDKRPARFMDLMRTLHRRGLDFELVLLGERCGNESAPEALDELQGHIMQLGFVENMREYARWLASCDLVVSCTLQENFGISIAEACTAGCRPRLPWDFAYPELLPESLHDECLYRNDDDLLDKLEQDIRNPQHLRTLTPIDAYRRFEAQEQLREWDDRLVRCIKT